ncbi:MAG TPA: GNAT family N-acetyltransferase [Alphaproteobacteria bacterium]|nr:GNAT family N-acetyltransferase [Alphaproteobacteria bacterium]
MSTDGCEILVTDTPDEADLDAIRAGLTAHNRFWVGTSERRMLAVLTKDADGRVLGGLRGYTGWGWLYVEHLWVSEALRGSGVGSELLHRAEEEATLRGCRAVWLDTFSFQARRFYEKLGYTVFGTLDDFPADRGHSRHFLQKRLTMNRSPAA